MEINRKKLAIAINKFLNINNQKYDIIGMYPPVKRLVAIGDLHGDLIATFKVLKLAEVIPQNAKMNDFILQCGSRKISVKRVFLPCVGLLFLITFESMQHFVYLPLIVSFVSFIFFWNFKLISFFLTHHY